MKNYILSLPMSHPFSLLNLTTSLKTIFWVAMFGMAFGLVESAVVVYIREMYYPEGFSFPLKAISTRVITTELWREAATILMLIAIGILAGKNAIQRFAYFLISFAVWDIFYYVFLKLFINCPESLFTWDILFLIPITWFGPVITPVILSILMIVLALMLLYKNQKLVLLEWALLILAAIISILSFTWDYISYLLESTAFQPKENIVNLSLTYVPRHFDWWIFSIAVLLILTVLVNYYLRTSKNQKKLQMMQMF